MRAVQVRKAGGDFELVEREVPQPGFGEALVRVHACGVCHSDVLAKEGAYPGVRYPLVPGHEVAGVIEALGEGVHGWQVGQRVGVGWFGGNCGYCEWCRRGLLLDCENMEIPGITVDGGYADFVVVRASAMASMPDDLAAEEAAPLLCAGITTYNALRRSGVRGGDRVAGVWVGGVGPPGGGVSGQLGVGEGGGCLGSAVPAMGACSPRSSWGWRRWRSLEGPRRSRSPASWARTITSTAPPVIRRRRCWSWGAST